jgi:hypothetical protein
MLACAAMLAVLVTPVGAEVRYDRKLEAAAKARVAEKIGDIRGGFEHGGVAEFVQPDPLVTDAAAPGQPNARSQAAAVSRQGPLTLATDRKLTDRAF